MNATLMVNIFLSMTLISTSLSGCTTAIKDQITNTTEKIIGSADDSHSDDAEPNYEVVFPQDSVNRIEITLTNESWTALQTEMEEEFGQTTFGGRGENNQGAQPAQGDFQQPDGFQPGNPGGANPGGQFPNNQQPPDNQQLPNNGDQRPGGLQPGNQGQGNPGGLNFGDTSYVISTVSFNGETWDSVGFRYSGNSTLQSSWRSGTQKISFRLDFDEFEDEDPSTKNQRFYGFKQLSFKSNAMDSSYLREKVTSDILLASGVIAPKTAFYEVYVDYGEGLQYFGLYTAVEIVDDTVIHTQFSDDSGNVYKPEGSGAAFVDGTFNEASFEKQTNEEEADWSDIQAVFDALNSDLRTSDPAAWRKGLEAVFDVDAFIRWLAVDTIIQNWDTYGSAAHNYYLYTDPEDGLVTWIPWDFNMALTDKAGNGQGGPQGKGVRELDLAAVDDQWPLIRSLIDDPTYWAKYHQYLQETIDGIFQPDKLEEMFTESHNLIAPYIEKETSDATQIKSIVSFNQAFEELVQHAQERYDEVVTYLKTN